MCVYVYFKFSDLARIDLINKKNNFTLKDVSMVILAYFQSQSGGETSLGWGLGGKVALRGGQKRQG